MLHRTIVFIGLACGWQAGSGAALWPETIQAAESTSGLIAAENRKPGSIDWQLTRVRVDGSGFRSTWIEGYCSKQSVEAGETIEIMVSTSPAQPFEIEIFRMGYYGGRGARSMTRLGPLAGKPQPTPKPGEKNIHECAWESAISLTIPATNGRAASISAD